MSEFCYVATKEGMAGYVAVCLDEPKYAKDVARTIAEWIGRGYTVSRVTPAEARTGLSVYMAGQPKDESKDEPKKRKRMTK